MDGRLDGLEVNELVLGHGILLSGFNGEFGSAHIRREFTSSLVS